MFLNAIKSLKAVWDETMAVNDRHAARTNRWADIFIAGGGTTSECLKADFGPDGPVGLNLKPWPEQFVKIENMIHSNWFKQASIWKKLTAHYPGGFVELGRSDAMHISPLEFTKPELQIKRALGLTPDSISYKGRLPGILTHEYTHTRQHYLRQSGFPFLFTGSNDIINIGMDDLSMSKRTWRHLSRIFQDAHHDTKYTVKKYYAQDIEMQARLNEIMAMAYAGWQKLPTSKTELWAALRNIGFKAPDDVIDMLDNTPDGQRATQAFKVAPTISTLTSGKVYTFNNIYDYVGEEKAQEFLWYQHYPLLYGNLIEQYGDIPGRERVGMGKNPRTAIEAHMYLKNAPQPLSQEEAARVAAQIEPEIAATFLNSLIIAQINPDRETHNDMLVTKALLARDDVRRILCSPEVKLYPFNAYSEQPSLKMAILRGNAKMVEALAQAGIPINQTIVYADTEGRKCSQRTVEEQIKELQSNYDDFANGKFPHRNAKKFWSSPEGNKYLITTQQNLSTMQELYWSKVPVDMLLSLKLLKHHTPVGQETSQPSLQIIHPV